MLLCDAMRICCRDSEGCEPIYAPHIQNRLLGIVESRPSEAQTVHTWILQETAARCLTNMLYGFGPALDSFLDPCKNSLERLLGVLQMSQLGSSFSFVYIVVRLIHMISIQR